MPGAPKIGAAISGPSIAGGNLMDITLFLRMATFFFVDLFGFVRVSPSTVGRAIGKPIDLDSEPFLKPIGRANSTRGQPWGVSEYSWKSDWENRWALIRSHS